MPRATLTKEQISELLQKSQERSVERYHAEFRKELWDRRRAEREKNEKEKIKKELLVNS